jgi:hypothetical protein
MTMTRGFAFLWVLAAVSGCGNGPAPIEPDMNAHQVVLRHAQAAFEVHFDLATEREALARFYRESKDAKDRADLTRIWDAVAELTAAGEDFLAKFVFEKAERDGDWSETLPAEQKEAAFVSGTRAGLDIVLGGGE